MAPDIMGTIILVITLLLFITQWIPPTATAILSIALFALTGAASYETCISGFSNNIIIMLFGVLIVGQAMLESGLATMIGRACLKLSRGHESRFLLYMMIAIGVLSMFIDNTTTVAVMLPIMASAVVESDGRMRFMNLVMPASLAAMAGGASLLIGCTVNLTGQSILLEYTGQSFTLTDFTVANLPVLVLVIVYCMTIGRKLAARIWVDGEHKALEQPAVNRYVSDRGAQPEINMRKCGIMAAILLLMICLFLFTDLPLGLTANVAALLCILFRLVSLKTALPRLDWDIIIRLACTLGLAAALQECGFCELISGAFISVFGSGISPWVIMVFTLVVSTVMSQFMGNSTVVLVLGAAILPIVTGLGYDPLAVTMALTMGSSFAWMTPIAGACIGITYSSGYRFTDYARYTGLLTVLMWAVAVIWLPLAFPF